MFGWKKIAVLFGFSICTAVFGAACAAEVTPTDEAQDPTDEPAVDEADAAATLSPLDHRDNDRYGRRRCESKCRERFDRCVRPDRGSSRYGRHDSDRRCRRERDQCFDRCGRR